MEPIGGQWACYICHIWAAILINVLGSKRKSKKCPKYRMQNYKLFWIIEPIRWSYPCNRVKMEKWRIYILFFNFERNYRPHNCLFLCFIRFGSAIPVKIFSIFTRLNEYTLQVYTFHLPVGASSQCYCVLGRTNAIKILVQRKYLSKCSFVSS